jgi:transcriptional regulator with XRE-family HTH domain
VESPVGILEIIAGSVRHERIRMGLSLAALARKAGISKSTLSQLESASGNPSFETLWALSFALGVPIGRLVERPIAQHTQVMRAASAARPEQAYEFIKLLAMCRRDAFCEIFWIKAEPGMPNAIEPHTSPVVNHLIIGSGRAVVRVGEELIELRTGDYVCYSGNLPHIFEALEPHTNATLVSEYR